MPSKTSLTDLREFLAAEGCAPKPWSTPEAVLERVFDLLLERRGDEQFWKRLKVLVAQLDERRFDRRALPGFEVLGDTVVDRLIDDLRDSLGDSAAEGRPLRPWLARSAGMAAVAFILFGLAVSCDNSESEGAPYDYQVAVDAWDCVEEAANYDITTPDEIERLCDLGDFVKESGVGSYEQDMMLDCLPGLDEAYRVSLLERFQNASDNELNDLLMEMTEDWAVCGHQYDSDRRYGGGCDIGCH